MDWVRDGGTLILIRNAIEAFEGKEGFSLKQVGFDKPEPELSDYGQQDRERLSRMSIGSIFRVRIDPTHPLAFGYGDLYFTNKMGDQLYAPLEKGWNVGLITDRREHISGFAGSEFLGKVGNSLFLGTENIGSGKVIYITDNILIRSFWENGKLFMANAVFFE